MRNKLVAAGVAALVLGLASPTPAQAAISETVTEGTVTRQVEHRPVSVSREVTLMVE